MAPFKDLKLKAPGDMNYKETLNLPKTDFPMKGNLAKREPLLQRRWEEMDLYGLIQQKRSDGPLFILHDGPPYANGDIHVGTAYNKILKDVILKYRTMRGFLCPYVPGWDCHGLPIEHEVSRTLGAGKVDRMELRRRCREYAMKYVERQAERFKRLGVFGDFVNPYLTLATHYEATNIEVFERLYEKGLVFRGSKPVHWCTNCVTALAEAEIEYEDKESSSIFVKFPLTSELPPGDWPDEPVSMLIWTTTPWTLPANVAIAVHGRFEYAVVESGGELLVMAEPLVDEVMPQIGADGYSVVGMINGGNLEGLTAKHPWSERDSVVVLADYVTLDAGTGCVHTAPGHGQEDYITGLEYDLPAPMPVDDYGYFTGEAFQFAGMALDEANPKIVEDLKDRGLLLGEGSVTHQYPHCWRCKKPVVFRATPQWFIALDRPLGEGEPTLRQAAMESIEGVDWIPGWTVNRIGSMVENRPDWCISRQRSWGVPIPVLYCVSCGSELVTPETLESIRLLIEAEGADAWFIEEPSEFLTEGTTCGRCGGGDFTKEYDIFDVWFESGVSHFAVARDRDELRWPTDLYLEGSDQHRGWFQSSLLLSVGCTGRPPFESVLTHGFTVDADGRKMSKSLRNAVDPRKVYSQSGADILRLWTAATDYSSDIPVSEEILSRVTESYRRIRNTLRFLLGNTYDFDPAEDALAPDDMREIDRWALSTLQSLVARVTGLWEKNVFHQAVQAVQLYCTVEMSSFYLDVMKDTLYTFPADSTERRSCQTALASIRDALILLVAPVLAHTAEEAWLAVPETHRAAPCAKGSDPFAQSTSVHLADWPVVCVDLLDPELEATLERLLEMRERVYRSLEDARQADLIGTGLEARVTIYAEGPSLELLRAVQADLPMILIVSQAEVRDLSGFSGGRASEGEVEVVVEKALGDKCQRCWNFSTLVGGDGEYPDICERCVGVLRGAS